MRKLSRRMLFAVAPLSLLLGSPAFPAEHVKRPRAAAEVWARTELYFGTNKPDNGQVTDAEFADFVDREVTPRFPDGLTLLTGYGQFRNEAGTLVRERSHVLILLYPPQTLEANKRIQDIRDRYKQAFYQESVLRVDSFSLVSF